MGWGLSLNGKEKVSYPPVFIPPCFLAADTTICGHVSPPWWDGTLQPNKSFLKMTLSHVLSQQ